MRGEDLNLELVREYRDAVDYIRTITETLQQLRKGRLRGSHDDEVLSVLAIDRMRRTSNLCLEVIADLDAGRIRRESKGIEELQRALQLLQQRLRQGGTARATSTVELNAPFEDRAELKRAEIEFAA